jgi:hypothetical protein
LAGGTVRLAGGTMQMAGRMVHLLTKRETLAG